MSSLAILLLFFSIFNICRSEELSKLANRTETSSTIEDPQRSTSFKYDRVVQLSQKPRVFLYKGFLTDEECDHLINVAKLNLTRSKVGHSFAHFSAGRTSRTAGLDDDDRVVARLKDRIEAWTLLPKAAGLTDGGLERSYIFNEEAVNCPPPFSLVGITDPNWICPIMGGSRSMDLTQVDGAVCFWRSENGEAMQVQRYLKGHHSTCHVDFMDNALPIAGGNRMVTVITYLSTVNKGGETYFPHAKVFDRYDPLSNCSSTGFAVKPRKGDALLFFNLNLDESPDETSQHGSCPVEEGEKWIVTHWVHVRAHRYSASLFKEGECRDHKANCKAWAAAGGCDRNDPHVLKFCKSSCHFCVFGAPS